MNPLVTACIDSCKEATLQDILENMAAVESGQVQMKVIDKDGKPTAAVILITEDVPAYLKALDKAEQEIIDADI